MEEPLAQNGGSRHVFKTGRSEAVGQVQVSDRLLVCRALRQANKAYRTSTTTCTSNCKFRLFY